LISFRSHKRIATSARIWRSQPSEVVIATDNEDQLLDEPFTFNIPISEYISFPGLYEVKSKDLKVRCF
jgi:hypothetical protein